MCNQYPFEPSPIGALKSYFSANAKTARSVTGTFLFLAFLQLAGAANHYIRAGATGASDGTSWINAWPTFASVNWVRGDTYYLAGGIYNENPIISVPPSGSTLIYIKKANLADNGSDIGFVATYATSVATIAGALDIDKGFVSLDGVTGSGTSGHGILISNTAFTNVLTLEDYSSFSISHCEIRGAGYAASTSAFSGISYNCIYVSQKNTAIRNCWIHEVTTNGVQILNVTGTSYSDYGFIFENNVISETGGCLDPTNHGQGMQLGQASELGYCILRNNVFRNINGSGMIVFLSSGNGAYHHDIQIYNNVFYITDLSTYSVISPGVIWAEQAGSYTGNGLVNLYIINNTFFGLGSPTANSVSGAIILHAPTTNTVLQNNLWENCRLSSPHVGVTSQSNNGYYGNSLNVPSGTLKQVSGVSSALVAAGSGDFHLTPGSYAIGKGKNIPALFTTDLEGKVRGGVWDLGAFQFATTADAPPSNAQVINNP